MNNFSASFVRAFFGWYRKSLLGSSRGRRTYVIRHALIASTIWLILRGIFRNANDNVLHLCAVLDVNYGGVLNIASGGIEGH
jgi:hypothetical protein